MTTANKITILRILLVPFFISQVIYYAQTGNELCRLLSIFSFAIASISDGIDGYIARKYHQQSELGAILDPLADKLLLASGAVLVSIDNGPILPRVPAWFVITIMSRDVLLLIGTLVIHTICGKVTVKPRFTGKLSTVLQMTTILWALFKWDQTILIRLAAGAAVLTTISGLLYVKDGMQQLGASPASSAVNHKNHNS